MGEGEGEAADSRGKRSGPTLVLSGQSGSTRAGGNRRGGAVALASSLLLLRVCKGASVAASACRCKAQEQAALADVPGAVGKGLLWEGNTTEFVDLRERERERARARERDVYY